MKNDLTIGASVAVLLVLLALGFQAQAQVADFDGIKAPQSKEEFCQLAKDPQNFKNLLKNPNNMTAFENDGGLFGADLTDEYLWILKKLGKNEGDTDIDKIQTSVCWWHSQLQRASAYLTYYRPDLAKPSSAQEVRAILKKLIRQKEVVEIPGYANWSEFTKDHQETIQKRFHEWMAEDTFLKQNWILSLPGAIAPLKSIKKNFTIDEEILKQSQREKTLKAFRKALESDEVLYAMVQTEGLGAHSVLFVDVLDQGDFYEAILIDSNEVMTNVRVRIDKKTGASYTTGSNNYDLGNTRIRLENQKFDPTYFDWEPPFIQKSRQLKRIRRVIDRHCGR